MKHKWKSDGNLPLSGSGKGNADSHKVWLEVQFSSIQVLSHVWLFATPWIAALYGERNSVEPGDGQRRWHFSWILKERRNKVIWNGGIVAARLCKPWRWSERRHECEEQIGCSISSRCCASCGVRKSIGMQGIKEPVNGSLGVIFLIISFPKCSFSHLCKSLCLDQYFVYCLYFLPFKIYSELLSLRMAILISCSWKKLIQICTY